jgi:hypothetical protein
MSRHGYSDDCDDYLQHGRWRGQVASAIRGKRGQEFLKELIQVLEAMPEKKLIRHELVKDGQFCTLGAIGHARGINIEAIDPSDHEELSKKLNIAHQLVQEIEYENDENCWPTDEMRWSKMYQWAKNHLKESK